MRILSLGFPLPGPGVDNFTFASAPVFFDYDAIVVEPRALSQLIEEIPAGTVEHKTRSGERVVNAPTTADAVALSAVLHDRREETARLLARGGLVVCFAYPNVAHRAVAGFAGCDRYFWLPAPPGLHYGPTLLRRGYGTEIIPIEHDHPFGSFIAQHRAKLAYHAYFADDAPGFAGAARVFARSVGGGAVGVEFACAPGRIIFLPPPARPLTGEQRYAFSHALQEAIWQMLRQAARGSPPSWLQRYELPDLNERRAALEAAQRALEQAHAALETSQAFLDELERYQRLLWQTGRYGLEEPVRAALALLGFRVVPDDLDTPAEAWLEARPGPTQMLIFEVDASDDAVGLDGHYRLRRRLEEAIATGKSKRGLLVINGHRTLDPSERPAQHQEALRVAAESMRYCVVTTEQLFHAVRAALAGDEATVAAFRQRLLTTDGILGHE